MSAEAWAFQGNAVTDENGLTVAIVVTEDDGHMLAAAPQMLGLLRQAAELMPLGTAKRAEWVRQAHLLIVEAEGRG